MIQVVGKILLIDSRTVTITDCFYQLSYRRFLK